MEWDFFLLSPKRGIFHLLSERFSFRADDPEDVFVVFQIRCCRTHIIAEGLQKPKHTGCQCRRGIAFVVKAVTVLSGVPGVGVSGYETNSSNEKDKNMKPSVQWRLSAHLHNFLVLLLDFSFCFSYGFGPADSSIDHLLFKLHDLVPKILRLTPSRFVVAESTQAENWRNESNHELRRQSWRHTKHSPRKSQGTELR